jgi:acyl carrier protein
MSTMTVNGLQSIMRASAGEDESVVLDGGYLDTPFIDLGYDSLALLEAAAFIKREYGVSIADEDFEELRTPRSLLERVNRELANA